MDFSLAAQSGHASWDGGTSRPHCGQIHVNIRSLYPMLPRRGRPLFWARKGSEGKRGRIPGPAANAIEGTGPEFHRHEGLGTKRAFEMAGRLAGKAKARIVIGMSENNDDPLTPPAQ